jgi:hypothetical protein
MQDHSYCSSLAKTSLVCKSTASVLCQATSASLKTKSQFKGGVVHLSPERLHLHAWFLSGIISDRKAFLKQLPSTSPGKCENPLASSMMQSGQSSLIGLPLLLAQRVSG